MVNTKRLDELFQMGLKFNGQEYHGEINGLRINFHYTEIMCDSDKVWNQKINKVKEVIERNDKETSIN